MRDPAHQIEADTRPLSKRVPEYVLRYDDAGAVAGVTLSS